MLPRSDFNLVYGSTQRVKGTERQRSCFDPLFLCVENNNVLKLDPFKQLGTPVEIINGVFGGKAQYEAALQALETELFKQAS